MICSLTYTSIGYFVTLAIERYVAIIHPFKYNQGFSSKHTALCLLVPVVYGFTIGGIPLLGWSGYARPHNNSIYCTFNFSLQSTQSYFIFACVVAFVGPVTVTAMCFIFILCELQKNTLRTRRTYGSSSTLTLQSSKSVKQQCVSLVLTGVVYVGSWFPYSFVCVLYLAQQEVSKEWEHVSRYMAKSSTISSTVVYCLLEIGFRAFVRRNSRRIVVRCERTLIKYTPNKWKTDGKPHSKMTKPTFV